MLCMCTILLDGKGRELVFPETNALPPCCCAAVLLMLRVLLCCWIYCNSAPLGDQGRVVTGASSLQSVSCCKGERIPWEPRHCFSFCRYYMAVPGIYIM